MSTGEPSVLGYWDRRGGVFPGLFDGQPKDWIGPSFLEYWDRSGGVLPGLFNDPGVYGGEPFYSMRGREPTVLEYLVQRGINTLGWNEWLNGQGSSPRPSVQPLSSPPPSGQLLPSKFPSQVARPGSSSNPLLSAIYDY